MVIIGLIGNKRVGKDTIADYLVNNYNFKKYAFADQIKKISNIIFGWNGEQLDGEQKDIIDDEPITDFHINFYSLYLIEKNLFYL